MKLIIVAVLAVVALAVAAPQKNEKDAQITRFENEQNPDGQFHYNAETDNGISLQQEGQVIQVPDEENKPQNVLVLRGSYSFVDPEGKTHTVNYVADQNGYRAESEDVPRN